MTCMDVSSLSLGMFDETPVAQPGESVSKEGNSGTVIKITIF